MLPPFLFLTLHLTHTKLSATNDIHLILKPFTTLKTQQAYTHIHHVFPYRQDHLDYQRQPSSQSTSLSSFLHFHCTPCLRHIKHSSQLEKPEPVKLTIKPIQSSGAMFENLMSHKRGPDNAAYSQRRQSLEDQGATKGTTIFSMRDLRHILSSYTNML